MADFITVIVLQWESLSYITSLLAKINQNHGRIVTEKTFSLQLFFRHAGAGAVVKQRSQITQSSLQKTFRHCWSCHVLLAENDLILLSVSGENGVIVAAVLRDDFSVNSAQHVPLSRINLSSFIFI